MFEANNNLYYAQYHLKHVYRPKRPDDEISKWGAIGGGGEVQLFTKILDR